VAAESPPPPAGPPRPDRAHFVLRAPTPLLSVAYIVVASAGLALLVWYPMSGEPLALAGFLGVFLLPALIAGGATPPLARALGGRFELHRSLLLALSSLLVVVGVVVVWRLVEVFFPSVAPSVVAILLFLQGPIFWFRHMTVYGISRASHLRGLPVSLLQPVLAVLVIFSLYAPTPALVGGTFVFFLLAFLCDLLLLRAADRPLKREFGASGMSLVRPMLEHVAARDPKATAALEGFFDRGATPTEVRVSLVSFSAQGRTKATVVLPTIHPGPFAALGASDLPRKLAEHLGPRAGTIFVPHTPCDHDLDLPTEAEVAKVAAATSGLFVTAGYTASNRASPLILPYPGSFARAQILGDVMLVVVTQAPAPTDDIAFSVADRIYRELGGRSARVLALIDAHNSYEEGKGDVIFGSPTAEKLVVDVKAAVTAAEQAVRPGPIEIGVAARKGYSIGVQGIGPEGMRALVIRAAGTTSAYVLIDGNNLILGVRSQVLRGLEGLVDVAEVMTTDNHVVHEVDGGINPVGERIPTPELAAEVRGVVTEALQNFEAVEVRAGTQEIPDVRTLGPGYTARLLTSLGDTRSMFANALLTTFLLLIASSAIVLVALR
jgi:putative membrane protein